MKSFGQIHLSFGMIFSIILIIAFIAFAVFGISFLLDLQEKGKVSLFKKNLQTDIDIAWESTRASQRMEYLIPSKINEVCFRSNNEFENIYFNPRGFSAGLLNHALIEADFCIPVNNGRIYIQLTKNYNQDLVKIERSRV